MKYGVILRSAWAMVRRRKVLWVFGLLAALGGGGFNFTWSIGNQTETLFELPLGTRALLRYVFNSPEMSTTLIAAGLVLGIIVFLVHTFAAGALIQLVSDADQRQTLTVSGGTRAGWRFFWRLLALRLVLAVPLLITGLIVTGTLESSLSSFFVAPMGERLFALSLLEQIAGSSVALVVVGLIMAGISLGAARALVLDNLSVWKAIVHGLKLLITKFVNYLVITLLFVVIGVVVSLAFAVLLAPIAFLSMLPSIGSNTSGFDAFMFTGDNFGPLAVLAIALALAIGTFVSAFASAVWTLAYRQWQTPERAEYHDVEDDEERFVPAAGSAKGD